MPTVTGLRGILRPAVGPFGVTIKNKTPKSIRRAVRHAEDEIRRKGLVLTKGARVRRKRSRRS